MKIIFNIFGIFNIICGVLIAIEIYQPSPLIMCVAYTTAGFLFLGIAKEK